MHSHSKQLLAIATSVTVLLSLAACGGSSSAPVAGSTNEFASMVGDYSSDCSTQIYTGGSELYTLNVGALQGEDSAEYTFNVKTYKQGACVESSKVVDVTVRGTFKSTGITKTISPQTALSSISSGGLNMSGTAKVLNVGISGTTLATWSGDFPSNILSTKVSYLLKDTKIYFLVNPTQSTDGLGSYFSPIFLTKK